MMLKRWGLALGFTGLVALTSSCDPCSIACLICLSGAGGGGQALAPGSANLSPQAKAIAEHVADPAPNAGQRF